MTCKNIILYYFEKKISAINYQQRSLIEGLNAVSKIDSVFFAS